MSENFKHHVKIEADVIPAELLTNPVVAASASGIVKRERERHSDVESNACTSRDVKLNNLIKEENCSNESLIMSPTNEGSVSIIDSSDDDENDQDDDDVQMDVHEVPLETDTRIIKELNDIEYEKQKSNSKRGRKPKDSTPKGRSKYSKQQVEENGVIKTYVYFGNKKVEVGTAEYEHRKAKRQEAVRKSRKVANEQRQQRTEKMRNIENQNRLLSAKKEALQKDISILNQLMQEIR